MTKDVSADWQRFLYQIGLLLLPFVVFFIPSSWILYQSGELTPITDVIQQQETQKQVVVYGMAYSQQVEPFKLKSVLHRKPEIVVLGTSRVLNLRTAFFNAHVNCYNAGKGASKLDEIYAFLCRIPAKQSPKILILGLDQYFFNHNWVNNNQQDTNALFDATKEWYDILMQGPIHAKVYSDFIDQKYALKDLTHEATIGLMAKATGLGYLNNGDMLGMGKNTEDKNFSDTFKRIAEGKSRFEYSSALSKKNIVELNTILKMCRKRGIHVVAFFPPFAQAVYRELYRRKKQYAYMWQLEPQLRPLFDQYRFSLFNFTDLQELSGNKPEYYDGFHASEKAYLRLFIKMAEADSLLAKYTSIDRLYQRLDSAKNDLFVFSEEESLRKLHDYR